MEPMLVIETRSVAYHATALPLKLHWPGAPPRSRTELSGIRDLRIAVNACSAVSDTRYSVVKDHKTNKKGRNLSIPALENSSQIVKDLGIATSGRFDRVSDLRIRLDMESAYH